MLGLFPIGKARKVMFRGKVSDSSKSGKQVEVCCPGSM